MHDYKLDPKAIGGNEYVERVMQLIEAHEAAAIQAARVDELKWVFDNAPYDNMPLWEARIRARLATLRGKENNPDSTST
jgi:hypothetical protein